MNWILHTADGVILSAAVGSFVAFLLSHILLFRMTPVEQSAKAMLSSIFLGGALNSGLIVWGVLSHDWGSWMTIAFLFSLGSVLYCLLVYHYVCWVFGMGEAAIRIRLVRTIHGCQGHEATARQIFDDYSAAKLLSMRLDRLTGSGHLASDGHNYSATSWPLTLQKTVIDCLRFILGEKRSVS